MSTASLDRRQVVARLLAKRDGLLVVTGLGSPTYDVHAAGDHDGNYYLWGAMGAAALIGLGLAQAQPVGDVLSGGTRHDRSRYAMAARSRLVSSQ